MRKNARSIIFDKKDELQIVDQYRSGLSILEIARRRNCHRDTIRRVLGRHDVKVVRPPSPGRPKLRPDITNRSAVA